VLAAQENKNGGECMRNRAAFRVLIASLALSFLHLLLADTHAKAADVSNCFASFTCNVFETDGTGNPSEVSNFFIIPAPLGSIPQVLWALLENPNGSAFEPGTWSDVLRITNAGNSSIGLFISDPCINTCGGVVGELRPPDRVILETQSGTGTDMDVTPFGPVGFADGSTWSFRFHSDAPVNETGDVPQSFRFHSDAPVNETGDVPPVSEPGTAVLLSSALAGFAALRRLRIVRSPLSR